MQRISSKSSLKGQAIGFFGVGLELLSVMFLIRLVVDIGNRIFSPFIPQLSFGLGLTIAAFSWLLALHALPGLASPVIGVLADRYGRRTVMFIALILRGIGLFGLGFSSGWWSAIPMLLIGLTTTAYMPVQRAYVSDQVSYERRGRALAAVDASYSTAGMIGIPIVGWMIEVWGWNLPLYVLGSLSFIAALVIMLRLPKTENRTQSHRIRSTAWKLFFQPRILAMMVVSVLLLFIFIIFMMSWALWLSEDFGFGPLEIGLIGKNIGIAEFAGLLLAGLFIDQIGKRRGSLIGLAATAILLLLILFFQQSLLAVQVMLVLTAVAIEFAITAVIPLFAEQVPEERATVFSLVTFGNTFGIGLAPPVTTYLWRWKGIGAIIVVVALSSLLAYFLVWKYLYDLQDKNQAKAKTHP
ncbi:MAG: MFS transporter [Chloroflexi bacterium]|nr:MFS transporter [Chloroflexota bacterium]